MTPPHDVLPSNKLAPATGARSELRERFSAVRGATERLCAPLELEDYVIQSMPDVSPTKWHLAHVSWFFETFVLQEALPDYQPYNRHYGVLFNSYYNTVGDQHFRPHRGLLSRPTVAEVMTYRGHVDRLMLDLLESPRDALTPELAEVIETGLQHEQQHQELMLMDIKHVFSCNPLRPMYRSLPDPSADVAAPPLRWIEQEADLFWIGHDGEGFAYDNERPRHRVFTEAFAVADRLTTCGEYLEFVEDGGYSRPELWLSDGWQTVQSERWEAPLYWQEEDGAWRVMTLGGMRRLCPAEPVCHVSYYEADAFARWARARLPSEAEWEIMAEPCPLVGNFVEAGFLHPAPLETSPAARNDPSVVEGDGVPACVVDSPLGVRPEDARREDRDLPRQLFGDVWEWTASAYLPYPGYRPPAGPLGEYNGKFMSGQMVLRGGACVTPISHIRPTYRNFYPPAARWPFTGIRLCSDA